MAWITPPVFVALQTLTDSVMNALSSRLSDLWTASATGDMSYASASDTLSRLAIGTAGQVLKTNSGATAPEWGQAITMDSFADSTIHGYGTNTYRDMPNSSMSITVNTTSTIIAVGLLEIYGSPAGSIDLKFNIDGGDTEEVSHLHTAGEVCVFPMLGIKTGVTSGSKTVKLREKAPNSTAYSIGLIHYVVLIIPE